MWLWFSDCGNVAKIVLFQQIITLLPICVIKIMKLILHADQFKLYHNGYLFLINSRHGKFIYINNLFLEMCFAELPKNLESFSVS